MKFTEISRRKCIMLILLISIEVFAGPYNPIGESSSSASSSPKIKAVKDNKRNNPSTERKISYRVCEYTEPGYSIVQIVPYDPVSDNNPNNQIQSCKSPGLLLLYKAYTHKNDIRTSLHSFVNMIHQEENIANIVGVENFKKKLQSMYKGCDSIWLVIRRLGKRFYRKLNIITYINKECDKKYLLGSFADYYDTFLEDLLEYINKNTTLINRHEALHEYAPKPTKETLCDIWCRKGLNREFYKKVEPHVAALEKRFGLNFKDKLQLILCIPEVVEDLYNLSDFALYEIARILSEECKRIEEKSKNASGSTTLKDLEIKQLVNNFCVIEYLHSVVHKKRKEWIEALYDKITQIYVHNNSENGDSAVTVYYEVRNLLELFYKKVPYYVQRFSCADSEAAKDEYIREEHRFLGKSVILKDEYIKCTVTLSINRDPDSYEIIDEKIETIKYSQINKSVTSPLLKPHYHVQFVNNSTHELKIVHLPCHFDKSLHHSQTIYFHTLEDIVQHIKRIYSISNKPGDVYSFKRNKKDKKWSVIEPHTEERTKTMQFFEKTGYNVVFYYIEEDLIEDHFVFAQFNPSMLSFDTDKEYKENKEKRIPLFLSPLLKTAVPLGPYNDIENMNRVNIYKDLQPYEYDHRFIIPTKLNSTPHSMLVERDDVEHYYSDLILMDTDSIYVDLNCYALSIEIPEVLGESKKTMEVSWCTRKLNSINEYTHFILDKEKTDPNLSDEIYSMALRMLIRFLGSFPTAKDTIRFSFYISSHKDMPAIERISRLDDVSAEILLKDESVFKTKPFNLIIVKDINSTMSKLGIHFDLMNLLIRQSTKYLRLQ